MEPFNLSKFAARKRIKDRGILWKQHYKDKSVSLKKRFDRDIGEGAYLRWEGHDYTTGSDYFVVVGPSTQRSGQKGFFAGIKKLPPRHRFNKRVYAPSGKYFQNIYSAIHFATNRWGIPFPPGQQRYDSNDLANINIPRHIKG